MRYYHVTGEVTLDEQDQQPRLVVPFDDIQTHVADGQLCVHLPPNLRPWPSGGCDADLATVTGKSASQIRREASRANTPE